MSYTWHIHYLVYPSQVDATYSSIDSNAFVYYTKIIITHTHTHETLHKHDGCITRDDMKWREYTKGLIVGLIFQHCAVFDMIIGRYGVGVWTRVFGLSETRTNKLCKNFCIINVNHNETIVRYIWLVCTIIGTYSIICNIIPIYI